MTQEDYLKEKKEYILSRDTVQLVDVDTVSMSVSKIKSIESNKKKVGLFINKALVKEMEETDTVKGTIEVKAEVLDEQDTCCAVIRVFQLGTFHAQARLSMEELYRRVDIQLVPQLLPYVRSTISILAAESGLAPIVLPTMDVIKSMWENAHKDEQEEA